MADLDQILCVASLGLIDLGTLDSGERSLPFGLLVKVSCLIFCKILGLVGMKIFLFFFLKAIKIAGSAKNKTGSVDLAETQVFFFRPYF